jgi:hypothetical protein
VLSSVDGMCVYTYLYMCSHVCVCVRARVRVYNRWLKEEEIVCVVTIEPNENIKYACMRERDRERGRERVLYIKTQTSSIYECIACAFV